MLDIVVGTFDLQSNGNDKLIIDSGTTITYLPQSAYEAVRQALTSSVNLSQVDGSSLSLCFNQQGSSNSSFPIMTFHFEGANYDLPLENYLLLNSDDVLCLAMQPAENGSISIFGNVQQQNYQIVL